MTRKKIKDQAAPEHEGPLPPWWRSPFLLIVIAIWGFSLYSSTLRAPFIFDDIAKIVRNPDIKSLSNIRTRLIYSYEENRTPYRNDPSRPLVYLTFMLNYHVGGLDPWGYHLVNIAAHILAAFAAFLLAKEISRRLDFSVSESNITAFLCAIFLVVHPINSNAVAYVFSRSDLLATAFYLLSLLMFMRSAGIMHQTFSLLLFLTALLFKQTAITLPATALLIDYCFLSGGRLREIGSRTRAHASFWALLIAFLAIRYWYLGGLGDLEAQSTWGRTPYMLIQPYVILNYLRMAVFPTGLSIDHLLRPPDSFFDPRVYVSILVIAAIVFGLVRLRGRGGGLSRGALFSGLWFFITISPTSSFIPTSSPLVENRVYLPGFGLWFLAALLYQLRSARCRPWLLVALLHAGLLSAATWRRTELYRDPLLLWADVVKKYPNQMRALDAMGSIHHERKEYKKAFEKYQAALALKSDYVDTHLNLGHLYNRIGDLKRAKDEYAMVTVLEPGNHTAHLGLGRIFTKLGRIDEAFRELRICLRLNPTSAKAHLGIGQAYRRQGKKGLALKAYRRALELDPDDATAHAELAMLFQDTGRDEEVLGEYRIALKIDPDNTEIINNLGLFHFSKKRFTKAAAEFHKALRLEPSHVEANINLGIIRSHQKKFPEALVHYKEALKSAPDNILVRKNLGVLFLRQKRYKDALREFRAALEIDPNDDFSREKAAALSGLGR